MKRSKIYHTFYCMILTIGLAIKGWGNTPLPHPPTIDGIAIWMDTVRVKKAGELKAVEPNTELPVLPETKLPGRVIKKVPTSKKQPKPVSVKTAPLPPTKVIKPKVVIRGAGIQIP